MTKTQKLNCSLFALISFALLALSWPAAAQGRNCGPRGDVVERLSTYFGETRRAIGLAQQNRMMEVFASDITGTWTIMVTLPDGRSCLLASGQSWEDRMDDLGHLADADT